MRAIDTNIFIRFLTKDDPSTAAACEHLLVDVEAGREEVLICESVLAEIAYVMRSQYGVSHSQIAEQIRTLILLRGVRLSRRPLYLRALDLYGAHAFLDFEDAVQIAHMEDEGVDEILTYDRDFDRIASIRRIEP
jgi:predicted nucleic acid-binding protein